jgi:hypothetical protein
VTYTITGPFPVLGQEPGTTLTDEQLDGFDVDWLIESGHIIATTEAAPADTTKEG